ncbi:FxsA family protein [Parendozoicomonas haliclonae]|uniref:Phage T7 F exclusion suppressor FxsA n=1 Tax=Parendozoicomonas haliclonae TaxID=1960125 RepID=A0A1X7AES6_9GAMM|nr:FxsA family protein [Parendozoicomonas haliclonae]SMA34913.1 phage T7 F exclusion suppressor FxsA [Parendozoicomonas haliclonae]
MRLGFMLLVLFPITELMILIKVGGLIGVLPTVALIFLTASAGLYLMRREGFSTLARARERMATGEIPATEMMEGLVIAFCGALLLAPGFITDVIALCGLLPPIRKALIKKAMASKRFQVYGSGASMMGGGFQSGPSQGYSGYQRSGTDDVIEGEYRRDE